MKKAIFFLLLFLPCLGFSQSDREEWFSKCIRESDKKTFYTTLKYNRFGGPNSSDVHGVIEYNDGYVDQFIVLDGSYLGDGKSRLLPIMGSSGPMSLFNCQFIRED